MENIIDFKHELNMVGKPVLSHDYELDAHKQYVIYENYEYFLHNTQMIFTIEMLGGVNNEHCNRVIKDYNTWASRYVADNGVISKDKLFKYYGNGPLWKNESTQGLVVKLIDDDITTYEVLVECSQRCTGFKYSKFVLSDAQCRNEAEEMCNKFMDEEFK